MAPGRETALPIGEAPASITGTPAVRAPVRARGRLLADTVVLGVLALWYLSSLRVPEFTLPGPGKVAATTVRLFVDPALWPHTAVSLGRVLVSMVAALALGSALVGIGRYLAITETLIAGRLTPFVNAFPTLGWAMLAVYWFGVSDFAVIFVEVAILLPFTLITMWEGINSLDPELVEMGRSFTRNPWRILRIVILPLLFPYVLAAARVSYGVAWKVSLIAELFGARRGLGYLLNTARHNYDTPLLFATIAAIVILTYVADRTVFDRLERLSSGRA